MRALASFVMRGRLQATATVVLITILLLLFFQPLIMFSSVAVALVTLRRGALEGAVVMLMSATACALMLLTAQADPVSIFGHVLLLWSPAWGLALLLRYSRSLGMTLIAALLIGVLVVIALYLQTSVEQWVKFLEPNLSVILERGGVQDAEQRKLLMEQLASWVPGGVATLLFLQLVSVLLLARWWQSLLYNPGGFRTEFLQLRLSRGIAAATIVLLLLSLTDLDIGGMLISYLILLLLAACFVHGLALMHWLADRHGVNTSMLAGMYLLLIIFMPYVASLLAAAGLADSWFDFRARPVIDDDSGAE